MGEQARTAGVEGVTRRHVRNDMAGSGRCMGLPIC